LKNAGTKNIGEKIKEVPKIRACLKCGTLIEHLTGCKHMACPRCECEFCFSCLKVKNVTWSDTCGYPYDVCPTGVAVVQIEFNTLF